MNYPSKVFFFWGVQKVKEFHPFLLVIINTTSTIITIPYTPDKSHKGKHPPKDTMNNILCHLGKTYKHLPGPQGHFGPMTSK